MDLTTKCGEVIFKNKDLLFTCNFCRNEFSKIREFICHLVTLHLKNDINENLLQQIYEKIDDNTQHCRNTSIIITNSNISKESPLINNTTQEVLKNSFLTKSISENQFEEESEINKYDEFEEQENNSSEFELNCDKSKTISNKTTDKEINKSSLTCKICNKTFRRTRDYKRHEKRGHGPNCGKKKYKYKYPYDIKRFICETCGKGFSKNYLLKQHQHEHTGERPYKCELCSKTFAKDYQIGYHMRYHDRRYKCQYCDKTFIEQPALRLHEMIHTDTFPFKCSLCEKGFRSRYQLKRHEKIHENDRMYRCEKCDKSFFHKNLLRKHATVHSDEKPFACEKCPARFPRKDALTLHMFLHSDKKKYSCKICGKEFHQYNGIYCHMKSHGIKYSIAYEKGESEGRSDVTTIENKEAGAEITKTPKRAAVPNDEKPFACVKCSTRFTSKAGLRLHMFLHSDKKKYSCKICGKEFRQYNGIYQHMKSHGIKYSSAYEKGKSDGRSDVTTIENKSVKIEIPDTRNPVTISRNPKSRKIEAPELEIPEYVISKSKK